MRLLAPKNKPSAICRFSTDEVYGELGPTGKFSETTNYQPNSPYSASKAASDLLTRAWFHTYQLPTITTNCSNNYGPKQFPEKLIPHMILCALARQTIAGLWQGREHSGLDSRERPRPRRIACARKRKAGRNLLFWRKFRKTNLEVVQLICAELDTARPLANGKKYASLISFVTDRPGHDFRYAIDDSKAQKELGYTREYKNFEQGIRDTVQWYLKYLNWCEKVTNKPGVKVKYDWENLKS